MKQFLLLLCVLGVGATTNVYFTCNDRDLTAMPEGVLGDPIDYLMGNFTISVQTSEPTKYVPHQPITVMLKRNSANLFIERFLLIARTPCETCEIQEPIGQWKTISLGTVTGQCTSEGAADNMVYQGANADPFVMVSAQWFPPEINARVEFIASVMGSDGHYYDHIRSNLLERAREGDEHKHDVHDDPSEFDEKPKNPDTEEGEQRNQESSEEEGPFEDPNEGERVEEDQYKESMKHDMGEDKEDSDHGRAREEELAIQLAEKRRKEIADELAESEGDWVKERLREIEEHEEEIQRELQEYEEKTAEEERRRQEMIRWEILDKERYDKEMAEKELEREKDTNRIKDLEEEIVENEIETMERISDSGSMVTASVAMVTLCAIWKMLV